VTVAKDLSQQRKRRVLEAAPHSGIALEISAEEIWAVIENLSDPEFADPCLERY